MPGDTLFDVLIGQVMAVHPELARCLQHPAQLRHHLIRLAEHVQQVKEHHHIHAAIGKTCLTCAGYGVDVIHPLLRCFLLQLLCRTRHDVQGVNHTTRSYLLRRHEGVSPRTAPKVQQLITRLQIHFLQGFSGVLAAVAWVEHQAHPPEEQAAHGFIGHGDSFGLGTSGIPYT